MRQRPPALVLGLAVVAVFVSLAPISYLVVRLGEFGVDKVLASVFRARSFELLSNSISLAACVAISAVIVGGFQAWLTVRTAIKGRALFAILAALPLAMPSYVTAYTFTALFPGFKGFGNFYLLIADTHCGRSTSSLRLMASFSPGSPENSNRCYPRRDLYLNGPAGHWLASQN